jgi:hypothetical protein
MDNSAINGFIVLVLVGLIGFLSWTLWGQFDWTHIRLILMLFVIWLLLRFSSEVAK